MWYMYSQREDDKNSSIVNFHNFFKYTIRSQFKRAIGKAKKQNEKKDYEV